MTTEALATNALVRPRQPWVLAGVASEIAYRLRAPAGVIRTALVLAAFFEFWPVLAVYATVALLVPHGSRRMPGWSNIVGVLRIAVFVAFAFGLSGNLSLGRDGVFGQGPGVWLPVGGVVVIGWVMLLTAQRDPSSATDAADRRQVLSALPAIALAGIVAACMAIAPEIRSDRILDLGIVAIGLGIVLSGPRINAAAAAMPTVLLGVFAAVLAFSGVSLEGGIGRTYAAPRTPASLSHAYRRAIGTVTLDLTRFRNTESRPAKVDLSVAIGDVRIMLPGGTTAAIGVWVGRGGVNNVFSLPATSGQFFVHRIVHADPSHVSLGRTQPLRVNITAHVGHGCVIISGPGEDAAGC